MPGSCSWITRATSSRTFPRDSWATRVKFLKDGTVCIVPVYDGTPVGAELPVTMRAGDHRYRARDQGRPGLGGAQSRRRSRPGRWCRCPCSSRRARDQGRYAVLANTCREREAPPRRLLVKNDEGQREGSRSTFFTKPRSGTRSLSNAFAAHEADGWVVPARTVRGGASWPRRLPPRTSRLRAGARRGRPGSPGRHRRARSLAYADRWAIERMPVDRPDASEDGPLRTAVAR